ncbi:MAG: hypothetical protein JNK72_20030 [Myxococcales bacterium]|nr:hypothetical protein [Myxococcales bacterium]
MQRALITLAALSGLACTPPITCGEGTHREGNLCLLDPFDAGASDAMALDAMALDAGAPAPRDAGADASAVTVDRVSNIDTGPSLDAPAASDLRCETAAEDRALTLRCAGDAVISEIVFASYGTPSACPAPSLGRCHAAQSAALLAGRCVGQASCAVTADNATFGDPCDQTVKQLTVVWRCGPGAPRDAGDGADVGSPRDLGVTPDAGRSDCVACSGEPPPLTRSYSDGEQVCEHDGPNREPVRVGLANGVYYLWAAWAGNQCEGGRCIYPNNVSECFQRGGRPVSDALRFARGDPRTGWRPDWMTRSVARTFCELAPICTWTVNGEARTVRARLRDGALYYEWFQEGSWRSAGRGLLTNVSGECLEADRNPLPSLSPLCFTDSAF